ncbi:MAG: hypothetical protein GWP75_09910, partial [Planctomycetia bacterium]|nr:hypothetical protein [Planctomycetia bacterium]
PLADGAIHYRDRGLGDRLMRAIQVEQVLAACRERLTTVHVESAP